MAKVLLNLLGAGSEQLSGIGMYSASIYAALLSRRRHDYVLLTSWKPEWLERHLPLGIARTGPAHQRIGPLRFARREFE